MKKVILIYPKSEDKPKKSAVLPLGLLCIAANVKNVEVKIIDQRIEGNWECVLRDSLDEDVVCVGITSMTGFQLNYAIEISKIVKRLSDIPVVWGGIHASLLPEQTIENDFVDIVVIGEGDITFAELVGHLIEKRDLESVEGIVYKRNGYIVFTTPRELMNLSQLSDIPYDLINMEDYIYNLSSTANERIVAIQTSRGCPYQCTFCYNTTFNKNKWRSMDTEKVVSSIRKLKEKYKITGIFLLDDNFFAYQKRAKEILRRSKEFNVEFLNLNCRADTLSRFDDELLEIMEDIGVRSFYSGIESGSKKILKKLKKDIQLEQVITANEKLNNTSIQPTYSFMIGFPFETSEDVKDTLHFICRLKRQNSSSIFGLNVFNPYPSKIIEECIEKGFVYPRKTEEWARKWENVYLPWINEKQRKKTKKMTYSVDLLGTPMESKNAIVKIIFSFFLSLTFFRLKYGFWGFYFERVVLDFYRKHLKNI